MQGARARPGSSVQTWLKGHEGAAKAKDAQGEGAEAPDGGKGGARELPAEYTQKTFQRSQWRRRWPRYRGAEGGTEGDGVSGSQ